MYIKNVVNTFTDATGLFCYYNEEVLLNADFYKGNIDLIGQTLVVTEDDINGVVPKTNLNFMSYKSNISESLTYDDFISNLAYRNKSIIECARNQLILCNRWQKKFIDLNHKIMYNREQFYRYVDKQRQLINQGIICQI